MVSPTPTPRVMLTEGERQSREEYDKLLTAVEDAYDAHAAAVNKLEEFRVTNQDFISSCKKVAAANTPA